MPSLPASTDDVCKALSQIHESALLIGRPSEFMASSELRALERFYLVGDRFGQLGHYEHEWVLRYYKALSLGGLIDTGRPMTEPSPVRADEALEILRELAEADRSNGSYAYYAIAIAGRAGVDPAPYFDEFISTTRFVSPDMWIEEATLRQGLRSLPDYLAAVVQWSHAPVLYSLESMKWIAERIPELSRSQRRRLVARLQKLVAESVEANSDSHALPYTVAKNLLGKIDAKFAEGMSAYARVRRYPYDPIELQTAMNRLNAKECDSSLMQAIFPKLVDFHSRSRRSGSE